jgi:hypothetical protein
MERVVLYSTGSWRVLAACLEMHEADLEGHIDGKFGDKHLQNNKRKPFNVRCLFCIQCT